MARVCLYQEIRGFVNRSGIGVSTHNYVKALQGQGIEVTTDLNGDYDLLHLQWIGPRSLHYAWQAHKKGRSVVLSVHTPPELVHGSFTFSGVVACIYDWYLRGFARNVDLFIAPSQFTAKVLAPIARGRPIHVVTSGVDLNRFCYSREKREAFRSRYGLDRPTVLSVGQVIPRKGVETFLEVARRLPEVLFIWIGTRLNPLLFYSPRFERLIRQRTENVRFIGFVEEIEAAYSGCDLFFFPSHAESLGLVILEAAAVGLPLVVRRLPVYQDWLQEEKHCLMGKDPEEFKEAIMRLLDEHPSSLSAAGLAEKHGLERVGVDLIAAYQEVL